MHHEVAPCCVLHDEAHVLLCLETRKQVDQERVADTVDRFENPLFAHETGGKRRRRCEPQLIEFHKELSGEHAYLSTSSRATMSPFFRALIANISPVLLYSANNTWGGKGSRDSSEEIHFSFLPETVTNYSSNYLYSWLKMCDISRLQLKHQDDATTDSIG